MSGDELYDDCIKILSNSDLLEEEQTEQVETLIASRTGLSGSALETKTLDVLWRHRNASSPAASPPIPRATIVRTVSPAPWQQIARVSTPVGTPPTGPPGFPTSLMAPGTSPFPSPRPSPRLPYNSLPIPHSPSLSAYEYATDTTPSLESYGDYGSDNVAWLVGDDGSSSSSFPGLMQQENMSPHDMLRSVLGEGRSDEEMERALEASGYDLSATLTALMEQGGGIGGNNGSNNGGNNGRGGGGSGFEGERSSTPARGIGYDGMTVVSGRSATTLSPQAEARSPGRPTTPRNGVVCRFFLSTGSCLRADCRFSHDLSSTICKYWVMGSCLAGDTCIFSHDPTQSASKLSEQQPAPRIVPTTPPPQFQLHDFPSLSPEQQHYSLNNALVSPPPGFKHLSGTRPLSRNQNRSPSPAIMSYGGMNMNMNMGIPSVDDTEAFPSLGSAKVGKRGNSRRNKNHHNHNNHNHNGGGGGGMKENDMHNMGRTSPKPIPTGPASLAEVVGMVSPSPQGRRYNHVAAASPPMRSASPYRSRQVNIGKSSNSAAASIPPPQQIPWLDTGDSVNKMYMKHRQAAIKHGQLRNKYLQAAAAAWGRNDPKAAKNLSLKGQSEQAEMRKAHREAAAIIYEQRQKKAREVAGTEMFIDLHGLHPEEAVEYLESKLLEQQSYPNPLYAITGTAHHSKNGKDKVQRAVRSFLDHWRYAYREFSAQGDRGGMGGILGIDPRSFDRNQGPWPGVNAGKNNNRNQKNNGGGGGVQVVSADAVGDGTAGDGSSFVAGGGVDDDEDGGPINADGRAPSNDIQITFKNGRGRKGSSKLSVTPPSEQDGDNDKNDGGEESVFGTSSAANDTGGVDNKGSDVPRVSTEEDMRDKLAGLSVDGGSASSSSAAETKGAATIEV